MPVWECVRLPGVLGPRGGQRRLGRAEQEVLGVEEVAALAVPGQGGQVRCLSAPKAA